jgi:hypothetical protein
MRVLKILSGIAVLLNSVHLAHAMHHFYALDPQHNLAFWAGMVLAILIDLLCFVGGYMLLKPGT